MDAESIVNELSNSSEIHHQRMESARRELLMAQLSSITEAQRRGLLSESVAEHAVIVLDEELLLSQEKQEEKVSKDSNITTSVNVEPQEDLSPDTFEKLAPPEVDDLLENVDVSESE